MALPPEKKRKIWIWIAIDRATGEVLAWEVGSRGEKTLRKLLRNIAHISCGYYATDRWKTYRKLIPKAKLRQSKKETQRIESVNNTVRHYLARFKRKSHCYSKSKAMLIATLVLFFAREKIIALYG